MRTVEGWISTPDTFRGGGRSAETKGVPTSPVVTWSAFGPGNLDGTRPGVGLRCASVLKPLYAWVAPSSLEADAERSVRYSDNAATDTVVSACGGVVGTLQRVAALTGLLVAPGQTWGRVVVDAPQVARLYRALAVADDPRSAQVRAWMRGVPDSQRLGLDRLWAQLTGQPVAQVGIKLGWDISEDEPFARTHAVLLGPTRSVVVMTAVPVTAHLRSRWNALLASEGPTAVLALHDDLSGPLLRAALHSCA